MADITPAPPQGSEIQEVIKLRNSSMILQFKSKEAANWLCIPENEHTFTRSFDPDATIRDCVHPIMVPRIPITFDPSNPEHLREVEEVNRLPNKTIKKARWIKLEYRHATGQSRAHAMFTITSVAAANAILKDGLYVCSIHTFPSKLKHELKQCMKCHKWGHFAVKCKAQEDTCGTCSGQHRMKECKVEGKQYCVSCRSDDHASWDCNCPEFIRKCNKYSMFHPENHLVCFPTEEDWMLTARPHKIRLEDKFLAHFNVGSLPTKPHDASTSNPPNRKER
ncbi:hypothetical protein EI94DRAFT_1609832 [Lactarius quietus]|nr:hypothetical protein EI94DRAFT_1609832 [Lactarius quietus]